jgi:hypothetical protein
MSEPQSEHPLFPEVVDEAGPTPRWLPIVGLCLLVVVMLMAIGRMATPDAASPASEETSVEPPTLVAEEAPPVLPAPLPAVAPAAAGEYFHEIKRFWVVPAMC